MRNLLPDLVIGVIILWLPGLPFGQSLSNSSVHSGLNTVFAQSEEPVLRYSDDIGNPNINLPGLSAQVVVEGLELPTTMAFLSENDILVLEKDKGTVRRVVDGQLQLEPILDVNVATEVERCMCGIAVSSANATGKTYVFLYFTEAEGEDGGTPIANRLYKYELTDDAEVISSGNNSTIPTIRLTNPQLLLDLPVLPGPRHNGGAISVGPDHNIYVPIGDTDKVEEDTQAQNGPDFPADGTGGILRLTQNGEPVVDSETGEYILGDSYPLNLYYAYGIRNSFGIDFDPVTGNLWDTENGPGYGDEINLVRPGFNSGWNQLMGIWERGGGDPREGDSTVAQQQPNTLVDFDGRGEYQPPKLAWLYTIGPTAIKFLNSDRYGSEVENDLFVGDIHAGNIYHFKLNQDRTELLLPPPLDDRLADTEQEGLLESIIFGTAFGGISDIEVSPYDGYMYVVSLGQGKIFKLVPTSGAIGGSVTTDNFVQDVVEPVFDANTTSSIPDVDEGVAEPTNGFNVPTDDSVNVGDNGNTGTNNNGDEENGNGDDVDEDE
jgi:glucose/arabinose dehydrogenase